MLILKTILIAGFMAILVGDANSQQTALRVIYIDNSNPSNDDMLGAGQLEELETLADRIKVEKTDFIMFLSKGDEGRIISSESSIDRLLSSLQKEYSPRPDAFRDVEKIRGQLHEKLNGTKLKSIDFDLFVTKATFRELQSQVNPLVHMLPKELTDLFGVQVSVRIHAKKSDTSATPQTNFKVESPNGGVAFNVVQHD